MVVSDTVINNMLLLGLGNVWNSAELRNVFLRTSIRTIVYWMYKSTWKDLTLLSCCCCPCDGKLSQHLLYFNNLYLTSKYRTSVIDGIIDPSRFTITR